jgi:uncharacterized protein (TIGR03083 family)
MTLTLRTKGSCELDPADLLGVFGAQRRRIITILRGFCPGDWASPTRCTAWSAHDVIRHLCDTNVKAAAVEPDDRVLDIAADFDPRSTPREWLAALAGEPPDTTLDRFVATGEERFAINAAWLSLLPGPGGAAVMTGPAFPVPARPGGA